METAHIQATYLFPDMKSWERHVMKLKDQEALNGAVDVLMLAKVRAGIHPFERDNKMGLARWWLNQRAGELDLYQLGSYPGYYRKSLTPGVARVKLVKP